MEVLDPIERMALASGLDYDRGNLTSARAALARSHELPAAGNLGGPVVIFGGSCSSASVSFSIFVVGSTTHTLSGSVSDEGR